MLVNLNESAFNITLAVFETEQDILSKYDSEYTVVLHI